MHPAISVILLTTLIGAGQGLLLALVGLEASAAVRGTSIEPLQPMLAGGSAVAFVLGALGLLASFFHLGQPMRAWRAATCWRTSWLSREVIALPAFLLLTAAYGAMHALRMAPTLPVGIAAAVAAALLFVCTGMVYAAVRVIREWASPLTVVNYALLGTASGVTLAAAIAGYALPQQASMLARVALATTVAAAAGRIAALVRNVRLASRTTTTLRTALGIRHPRIVQVSPGMPAGSFGTREFHAGATADRLAAVRWSFLAFAFAVPAAVMSAGIDSSTASIAFVAAFVVQYAGMLAERWHFFADARHPQNLYHGPVG